MDGYGVAVVPDGACASFDCVEQTGYGCLHKGDGVDFQRHHRLVGVAMNPRSGLLFQSWFPLSSL